MKKLWLGILVVVVLGVGATLLFSLSGSSATAGGKLAFVEVTRGDLEEVASCTGTLTAVGTVEIGTQVSGTINEVLVDFNDTVRTGQVLAILDTTVLAGTVKDAEAGVLRTEAELELAADNYERHRRLYEAALVSDLEMLTAKTSYMTAQASRDAAAAALDRARTNLGYAVIRSPIDGTVIYRTVERGQTVAASLSTPQLFIVAEDLANMEIYAAVDESDIGQVKVGQEVEFTVQTYLDETFTGTVSQIWLQPTTVQNVVTYTVVVEADNQQGLLLPGMTATLDIMLEQREDVLLVPNAALRFQPDSEMLQQARENMPGSPGRPRAQQTDGENPAPDAGSYGPQGGEAPGNIAHVWYVDSEGRVRMSRIQTGITDGRSTEIVAGRDISEGMQLICSAGSSQSSQSSEAMRPRGFGGPPF